MEKTRIRIDLEMWGGNAALLAERARSLLWDAWRLAADYQADGCGSVAGAGKEMGFAVTQKGEGATEPLPEIVSELSKIVDERGKGKAEEPEPQPQAEPQQAAEPEQPQPQPQQAAEQPKASKAMLRKAVDSVRDRIEGEGWRDGQGEGFAQYHRPLTAIFREIASRLGQTFVPPYEVTKASELPEALWPTFVKEAESVVIEDGRPVVGLWRIQDLGDLPF